MAERKRTPGKTIWLTNKEFALLNESREVFRLLTGAKMSWGAYLCALSLGGVAAKALTGLLIRCPDCGMEVAMTLENPRVKRLPHAKSLPGQATESHNQSPAVGSAKAPQPQP